MKKYICIHGHFYQPPRENPWLGKVEIQDSAKPFHDWNERIADECYAPNTAARILDSEGRIIQIIDNYSKMSFNFGPTLLNWLQTHSPNIYNAILESDKKSMRLFSGFGSAMAQAYHHSILPLTNSKDKESEIFWGIEDFTSRYGRKPLGMWLAETAINTETLEVLAKYGIKYTVLAPHQALKFRHKDDSKWQDADNASIDTTRAYYAKLPSGNSINLFFYNGSVAQKVAFDGLLKDGKHFFEMLNSNFNGQEVDSKLIHIATDGETYGHHHEYGEMALAYLFHLIDNSEDVELTNYSEFLHKCPPDFEVQINENTSWSCAHGVDRWQKDCGCHTGSHPDWNQKWRRPLRDSLNWLRDTVTPLYVKHAAKLFDDSSYAFNDYIHVVCDRSEISLKDFFSRNSTRKLTTLDQNSALKLLEIKRHMLMMFTSCGWFFDEVSRIETIQILQYAKRVIHLSEELFKVPKLEEHFIERLSQAPSNRNKYQNCADVYEKHVKPVLVDLKKVGAHYAINLLFTDYPPNIKLYCYEIDRAGGAIILESGKSKLIAAKVRISSHITGGYKTFEIAAIHFGDHNLTAGVRNYSGDETFESLKLDLIETFQRGQLPEVIRLFDKYYKDDIYSLQNLFKDDQRKILNLVLKDTLSEIGSIYHRLYKQQAPLIHFLTHMDTPVPKPLKVAAELYMENNIMESLNSVEINYLKLKKIFEEFKGQKVDIDKENISYLIQHKLEEMIEIFNRNPQDMFVLNNIIKITTLLKNLPINVNLWKVQNCFYSILTSSYSSYKQHCNGGNDSAVEWCRLFKILGDSINVYVE